MMFLRVENRRPIGRLRQDVAARRVIWTVLGEFLSAVRAGAARPGYDLVAAQMGRSNDCRVPTVLDWFRVASNGGLLASHASERWLEAAVGRGFCDNATTPPRIASDLKPTAGLRSMSSQMAISVSRRL